MHISRNISKRDVGYIVISALILCLFLSFLFKPAISKFTTVVKDNTVINQYSLTDIVDYKDSKYEIKPLAYSTMNTDIAIVGYLVSKDGMHSIVNIPYMTNYLGLQNIGVYGIPIVTDKSSNVHISDKLLRCVGRLEETENDLVQFKVSYTEELPVDEYSVQHLEYLEFCEYGYFMEFMKLLDNVSGLYGTELNNEDTSMNDLLELQQLSINSISDIKYYFDSIYYNDTDMMTLALGDLKNIYTNPIKYKDTLAVKENLDAMRLAILNELVKWGGV